MASDIGLIDYGAGNVQSVVNALTRLGRSTEIVRSGAELVALDAPVIVLPGVGAIDFAVKQLHDLGFVDPLQKMVPEGGRAFLGICVGMQVLFSRCKEFEACEGLGWFPDDVEFLNGHQPDLRVPHVGWNDLQTDPEDPVFAALSDEHFYFVHSCGCRSDADYVKARCDYGGTFAAGVRRDNIVAAQFHPEKSSGAGDTFLTNFLDLADKC